MEAPAHPTNRQSRDRRAASGVQTRLPWWGLLLPALGFVVLLTLLVGGGQADAAQHIGDNPVVAFFVWVRDALLS